MMNLKNMTALIKSEVELTWIAIGSDVMNAMAEAEMEIDREIAMEQVIDANRLATFGGKHGKAADDLVSMAIATNGYNQVLRYLADHIRLV
jgi:hypothetical protein